MPRFPTFFQTDLELLIACMNYFIGNIQASSSLSEILATAFGGLRRRKLGLQSLKSHIDEFEVSCGPDKFFVYLYVCHCLHLRAKLGKCICTATEAWQVHVCACELHATEC